MRFFWILLPFLLLAACADDAEEVLPLSGGATEAPGNNLAPGEVKFRGEVIGSSSGCEVDGICSITVRVSEVLEGSAVQEGEEVLVVEARGLSVVPCVMSSGWGAVPGSIVEIFAGPDPYAPLSLCGNEAYYESVIEQPYEPPCTVVVTPVDGTPTAVPASCAPGAEPICTAIASPAGYPTTVINVPCSVYSLPSTSPLPSVTPTGTPWPYGKLPPGKLVSGELSFRGVVTRVNDACLSGTLCWASVQITELLYGDGIAAGDSVTVIEETGLSSTPCLNTGWSTRAHRVVDTLVEVRAAPDEYGILSLCIDEASYERIIGGPTS